MHSVFKNIRLINYQMSTFTQIINPIIGVSSWELQHENYDFIQEIARAGFGDMLHDTERNQKYYKSLHKTIMKLHENGKEAHVLDIGTGTGILSMMAVKCGADTVTACEAFSPMANCAEKVINANGMSKNITLIKKRSTDITIGEDAVGNYDMKRKANVLVTELFDTELIGEGAIGIFNHAHEHLLTDDCIVIPNSASIYVQVIESSLVNSWNKPKVLANLEGDVLLKTPSEINQCFGEPSVHDIQLSQLDVDAFKVLSEPLKIFDFQFSSEKCLPVERHNIMKIVASSTGIAQAVFFWWDLKMDQDNEIILSCAPYWHHPDFHNLVQTSGPKDRLQNLIPWRDHWMQAIYHLPQPVLLNKGSEFKLNSYHDEYSFWFNIPKNIEDTKKLKKFSCSCSCGFHMAYSRNRIGQLNNNVRNKKYLQILEDQINENTVILCLSEGSLLGLAAKNLNAKSLICFEPHRMSRNVMENYIKQNKINNVKLITSLDEIDNFNEISLVFAEPYYTTSILPWDNFYFGTLLNGIQEKIKKDVFIMPRTAKIMAIPVQFLDLHKIRMPLKQCEGFNLEIFDEMLETASQLTDSLVEAQPLWEYPCVALGEAHDLLKIDFLNFKTVLNEKGNIAFKSNGVCNGIALWVDWDLNGCNNPKYTVSTGPTTLIEPGKFISWEMFTRQGVHLLSHPVVIENLDKCIQYNVSFKPSTGDMKFSFHVL